MSFLGLPKSTAAMSGLASEPQSLSYLANFPTSLHRYRATFLKTYFSISFYCLACASFLPSNPHPERSHVSFPSPYPSASTLGFP